ncbi:MAG: hypothetical protein QOC69_1619, partial [Mycobacterium sp.]|nr:hypothetical protein [Mycobacterium sp.]
MLCTVAWKVHSLRARAKPRPVNRR